jgi:hypothetical protein
LERGDLSPLLYSFVGDPQSLGADHQSGDKSVHSKLDREQCLCRHSRKRVWPELSALAGITWGKARRWRETSQARCLEFAGNTLEIGQRKMAQAVPSNELKLSVLVNACLSE